LKKTQKEIETLETRILMHPTEERTDQLKQMQAALKIINAIKDNEFVPASWRGIALD